MVRAIADVVNATGRPVLLILDTLESLTLRGDSITGELRAWLDNLRRTIGRIAVLAAGRGEPPAGLLAGSEDGRVLLALDDAMAEELLARLDIHGRTAESLRAMAKGNPLVLRLGARLIHEAGEAELENEELSPNMSARLLAGQLYRIILSRLTDPQLRAVAHPGLLIRRINAELIQEVIVPEIELTHIDSEQAEGLCEGLRRYAWLVRVEGGWLIHRTEMRSVLLELQIANDPLRARRLFKAAAKWFAARPESWATAEALYYRLLLARWGGRLPRIDADLRLAPVEGHDRGSAAPRPRRDSGGARRTKRTAARRRHGREDGGAPDAHRRPHRGNLDAGRPRGVRRGDEHDRPRGRRRRARPETPGYDEVIEVLWRSGDAAAARRLIARRDRMWPDWRLPDHADRALGLLNARADLDPEALRAQLRHDREWAARVAGLFEHGTKAAWEADLVALLLRAENIESHSELAEALWTLWVGDRPFAVRLAILGQSERVKQAEDRMRTVLSTPRCCPAKPRRAMGWRNWSRCSPRARSMPQCWETRCAGSLTRLRPNC